MEWPSPQHYQSGCRLGHNRGPEERGGEGRGGEGRGGEGRGGEGRGGEGRGGEERGGEGRLIPKFQFLITYEDIKNLNARLI